MGNVVIGGTATGATALPTYPTTVDRANDLLAIYSNANLGTYSISPNSMLGIAGAPVGTTDTQTISAKTINNSTISNSNTLTLKDGTSFKLQNASDTTKQAEFSLASITTGTTRTYTLPDVTDTLVTLGATQTLTSKTLTSPTINTPTISGGTQSSPVITTPEIITSLNDTNGNTLLGVTATSSAVNYANIANAATGNPPVISALGSDSNVDLQTKGKGTGKSYPDSITEWAFPFVVSGLVWSGDSYGSSLNGSMTAGFAYVNGTRVTVAAVSGHAFTASKDTYIDLDNSGTLHYTEVTNNAASPALTSGYLRIAIIVSGSTSIAASTSINQGQETCVLPIASSIPYAVTDSLGNLICPRDPNRRVLGYRQITSDFLSTTAGSDVDVTGLSMPIIVPANRKIRLTTYCRNFSGNGTVQGFLKESNGTLIQSGVTQAVGGQFNLTSTLTPSSTTITYKVAVNQSSTGSVIYRGTAMIMAELV